MTNPFKLIDARLDNIESLLLEIKSEELQQSNHSQRKRLFTRSSAADYLKVSKTTLDNWTRSGRLKRRCVGGRVYFTQEDIDSALVAVQ